MLTQGLFMLLSTLVRFLTSGVLFILLARIWSVEEFGVFMYAFVLTGLLARAIDYGFPLQLVRDVGREPGRVRTFVDEATITKLLLSLLSAAVLAGLTAFAPGLREGATIIWLLFAAAVLNSFGTFLQLPLRGLGSFDLEARIVSIYNPLHFGASVGLALAGAGPVAVAAAFVASRVFYLALAVHGYERAVGPLRPFEVERRALLRVLRTGLPFGIHTALGTLYMQVDTLVIEAFQGAEGVGLYQAGARLFLAGMIFADVVANTYLVRMSGLSADPRALAATGTRMTRHLLVVGLLGFAVMAGAADLVVGTLYGGGYEATAALLPWFGVALLVRFGAYTYATALTVVERQTVRAVVGAIALAANVALNLVLVPRFGLFGAVAATIATNALIGLAYAAFTRRELGSFFWSRRATALLALTLVAALWFRASEGAAALRYGGIVLTMLLALPVGLPVRELAGLRRLGAERLRGRKRGGDERQERG